MPHNKYHDSEMLCGCTAMVCYTWYNALCACEQAAPGKRAAPAKLNPPPSKKAKAAPAAAPAAKAQTTAPASQSGQFLMLHMLPMPASPPWPSPGTLRLQALYSFACFLLDAFGDQCKQDILYKTVKPAT